MPVFVGTSGWQYRHWRATFYPETLAQGAWLEYYAERFQVVEINNTFYRLPPPETFAGWFRRTPSDFILAPKASRYLTHIRRLKDPEEPVNRFLEHAKPLGSKMGPILVQLPPNLAIDVARLDDTLARFPSSVRVAVEFRHDSWFVDDVRRVLTDHGAAMCLVDRHSRVQGPLWATADWTYLRFHEGTATPHPCYGRGALDRWARRLAEEWGPKADAYVFFNNDPRACALRDAIVFARRTKAAGLDPTRVPASRDVTVA